MMSFNDRAVADKQSALYVIVSDTYFGNRNVIDKSLFDWGEGNERNE